MDKIVWILSPEDYKTYIEEHPEKMQKMEEVDYYGLRFQTSEPTTENRAMRRAKKKRAGD